MLLCGWIFIADNLVDYQITKEVKFTAEHRDKLAAVQQAVNPHVAPVADSAVSIYNVSHILVEFTATLLVFFFQDIVLYIPFFIFISSNLFLIYSFSLSILLSL